jgi:hypothetical protein
MRTHRQSSGNQREDGVEATGTFMRHLTSGRRDLLQDEFALLQSDFTGDVFYCSGSFADDPSSRPSDGRRPGRRYAADLLR